MKAPVVAGLRRLAAGIAVTVAVLGALMLPGTAHAATASRGAAVLAAAHTRTGAWYSYGAAGPSAFDCSGLVVWAARQAGITLPHSTYAMLASGHLIPTWHPVAGDLAFYGAGHVEIVDYGHDVTFGALHSGTTVGRHTWSGWWHPTMYFKVV